MASLIVRNARITTLDPAQPEASALAVSQGQVVAVGDEDTVMPLASPQTTLVDAQGMRLIPGLNDSHLHVIRGGLNYNMELRWDGIPSLAEALQRLKWQAQSTPPPQWVRVVGGWNEFQFKERRLPTLQEINAVSPDTPVFILHLYCQAILNQAALRAIGYTRETPNPPGGEIQRDTQGNPTGMLIARPNATILYSALARGPRLEYQDQLNSTRQFMRELNRLGLTSIIDAGGGYQNYPEDYQVIQELERRDQLTLRIAYNLFTQHPQEELEDFRRWTSQLKPGSGSDWFKLNGAGEMLVFSAADFEDFLEPRPDLIPQMENQLERVIGLLVAQRWPFRLHATYNESISRFLDVFERVNRDIPFNGLRWFFDHCETIDERNLERVSRLQGGIAVQHRMAFQGEYFVQRYGAAAARQTPPISKMLASGLPVGAGTDATRVASYNPWVSLAWLVTGRTVGGLELYGPENLQTRQRALELYTHGSAWFSGEESRKGRLKVGQLADFCILNQDYFQVPSQQIRAIESCLTVVGGKVVWANAPFQHLSPDPLPVSPDWSPVRNYGGHFQGSIPDLHRGCSQHQGFFGPGCDCFAF
ncbi:amidohydrolase [bacterium]|nr:amidohydrolase [bacterium]